MRASGHAQIATPMGSYHGDPLCHLRPRLTNAMAMQRRWAACLSGVDPTTLDQRWRRRLDDGGQLHNLAPEDRLAAIMLFPTPKWSDLQECEAPAYVPYSVTVAWKSVESVLKEVADGLGDEAIERRLGIDIELVRKVRTTASEFAIWSGLGFGRGRAEIHHPRMTKFGSRLAQMIAEESSDLVLVSSEWVSLARSASVTEGCPLVSDDACQALERVATATGVALVSSQRPGNPTVYHLGGMDNAGSYGAWLALRWALTVAWVGGRVSSRKLPETKVDA